MKKQLVIASAIAAMATAGLLGGAAFATTQSSGDDPMSSLVSALATKFNLKAADVQAVFDANRTQMQAEREQEVKDQVAQLVTDGKLTQAQADKINAKRTELQKERDAARTAAQADDTVSDSDRRAAMEAKRTELDTWLDDNDIDSEYVYLLMGGRGHGGPDGGRGGNRGE